MRKLSKKTMSTRLLYCKRIEMEELTHDQDQLYKVIYDLQNGWDIKKRDREGRVTGRGQDMDGLIGFIEWGYPRILQWQTEKEIYESKYISFKFFYLCYVFIH